MTQLFKAAGLAWILTDLQGVTEFAQQAPKSVLINGENLPIAVARVCRPDDPRQRPHRSARQMAGLAKWRFALPGGHAAGAALDPDRSAIIDDQDTRTFAELDRRTNALSTAMADLGIDPNQPIGVLAHNHVGMV